VPVGAPPSSAARLAGARALVTGGGSSIGLGATRVLARDGALVTMVGRNGEKLRDAAARLRDDEGLDVDWVIADVTDEAQIEAAVARAAADTGRLDICVASAGGATMSPIVDYELHNFHEPFRLNVMGSYLTLKHACRTMTAGGSFIAISSESAVIPIRNLSAYCSSKAGLDMLTRVAADELGARGIRVNGIRPGLTRREAPSPIFTNDDVMRRYREQTPLVRSGVPDDCAYAIRFFAGPESSWTTGQCLTIDGGMDLRGAPDLSSALSRFRELTESPS
jgi:NAD(P)-dependent dehydrogenase (short-subunit alcohol dehydrogenase family)